MNQVNEPLLLKLIEAKSYKARAVAVRYLRYNGEKISNSLFLLKNVIKDSHGRVRLEAMVAASWLPKEEALDVMRDLDTKLNTDKTSKTVYATIMKHLTGQEIEVVKKDKRTLKGHEKTFALGREVYHRDGHCGTCHQEDGKGLSAAFFPPLAKSEWVTGSQDRLIKIALHGIHGPMSVNGVKYPGPVPMTPMKHLSDKEMAAVLTYVRNSFGNKASVVSPAKVSKVRSSTKSKVGFYTAKELLKAHPK